MRDLVYHRLTLPTTVRGSCRQVGKAWVGSELHAHGAQMKGRNENGRWREEGGGVMEGRC